MAPGSKKRPSVGILADQLMASGHNKIGLVFAFFVRPLYYSRNEEQIQSPVEPGAVKGICQDLAFGPEAPKKEKERG